MKCNRVFSVEVFVNQKTFVVMVSLTNHDKQLEGGKTMTMKRPVRPIPLWHGILVEFVLGMLLTMGFVAALGNIGAATVLVVWFFAGRWFVRAGLRSIGATQSWSIEDALRWGFFGGMMIALVITQAAWPSSEPPAHEWEGVWNLAASYAIVLGVILSAMKIMDARDALLPTSMKTLIGKPSDPP